MKKKLFSVLLASVMAASLVACSSSSSSSSDSDTEEETEETVEEEEEEAEEEATEEAEEEEAEEAEEEAAAEETETSSYTLEGADLRIAWWGSQDRHNATIEVLDELAEETGSTFSYEYNSWTSYFEDLATQAVGGNLPDVIQMSTTDIINYSQNGQVIDLQEYVDSGIIDSTYIGTDAFSGGMVDGQLAGITSGTNTVTVAYNKSIFDEAGVEYPSDDWTWSEFLETVQAIYDATGIPTDIPFLAEARWVVESWVRSYGYDLFSEDGESLPWADDEQVVSGIASAMDDIYEGIQAGYFVDPEIQVAWSTTEENYIVQGKSAMSFMLSNYVESYSEVLGEGLGMAMLPIMDDGIQTGMYLNSNMYWCISANCEDPEAAAAVINYLINDADAAAVIGTDRGISLNSEIRDQLQNSDDTGEYTKNTFEYCSRVSDVVAEINPADPANSSEAIAVLKSDFTAVCYGEMTGEECIEDFISQSALILPD